MKRSRLIKYLPCLLFFIQGSAFAQSRCEITNEVFKAGEELNYKISYNLGFIWADAGIVKFSVDTASINGKHFYHYTGVGGTVPKYSWIYRVNDKYESYVDTATLMPYRFMRDVHEGSHDLYEDYYFFPKKKKAYLTRKELKKSMERDSVSIDECTLDPISAIYYARNIDYSKCKPNELIKISMIISHKVYNISIRYVGIEVFDAGALGKFRCVKFKPQLVEGTLFKGGENMTVWITDDKNRIALYVESEILIGSVKAYLTTFKNLRHPMDSKVK